MPLIRRIYSSPFYHLKEDLKNKFIEVTRQEIESGNLNLSINANTKIHLGFGFNNIFVNSLENSGLSTQDKEWLQDPENKGIIIDNIIKSGMLRPIKPSLVQELRRFRHDGVSGELIPMLSSAIGRLVATFTINPIMNFNTVEADRLAMQVSGSGGDTNPVNVKNENYLAAMRNSNSFISQAMDEILEESPVKYTDKGMALRPPSIAARYIKICAQQRSFGLAVVPVEIDTSNIAVSEIVADNSVGSQPLTEATAVPLARSARYTSTIIQ